MVIQAAIALVISALNMKQLRRDGSQLPRLVNLFFDLILIFYAMAFAFMHFDMISYSGCSSWGRPNCRDVELVGKILVGIAATASLVLG